MRRLRSAGTAFVLCAVIATSCLIAPRSATAAVGLSLQAGAFFPAGADYRRMYGNSLPTSFSLTIGARRGFGLSIGLGTMRNSGRTEAVDGGDDEYQLRLSTVSIPVTVCYSFRSGRFDLRLDGGAVYCSIREEWTTENLTLKAHDLGARFGFQTGYRLSGRFMVFVQLLYDRVKVSSSMLVGDVQIGGFQSLVGVRFDVGRDRKRGDQTSLHR